MYGYDVSAKEKRKILWHFLNENAQVTGKLALAGNRRPSRTHDPHRPGCGA